MKFNPLKCQVIQVTGSRKPINTNYRLHGQVLETVICARFSSGLSLRSHTDTITGSATKPLNFVSRNIKTKHPGVREMTYNTLVRPQLVYLKTI